MTDKQKLIDIAKNVGAAVEYGFFGRIKAIHWRGDTYFPRVYPHFTEFFDRADGWSNPLTSSLSEIDLSRWEIIQHGRDAYDHDRFSVELDGISLGSAIQIRNWDGVSIDRVIFNCRFRDLTIYAVASEAATRLIHAQNDKIQAERKEFQAKIAAEVVQQQGDAMRMVRQFIYSDGQYEGPSQ
jgi:hypothetical protein